MGRRPEAIDPRAPIEEARRLRIPVIAITDSNCDPDDVDYLIPGNDDAIRSVRLISAGIAEAAIQGAMRAEVSQSERLMDMGAAAADYEVESDGSDADDATAVAAN